MPAELPILPLRGVVIFPSAIVPLLISRGASLKLVEECLAGDRMLGLAAQKNPEDESPAPEGLYSRGTAGRILKMLKYPDQSVRILVQGLRRIEIAGFTQREPYFRARVRHLQDTFAPSKDRRRPMQVIRVAQSIQTSTEALSAYRAMSRAFSYEIRRWHMARLSDGS